MRFPRWFAAVTAAFFLALALLAARTASVQAGPPAPVDTVHTQPDGTQVDMRLWGDEWQFGYETLDGYTLVEDPASGFLVYAGLGPDGSLVPALRDGRALLPGVDTPEGLPQGLRPAPDAPALGIGLNSQRQNFGPARGSPEGALQAYQLSNGRRNLLVILAKFKNISNLYPSASFRELVFGANKSVADFYETASNGHLALAPAQESFNVPDDGIVGWITLDFNHPDGFADADSFQVARGALSKADPYVNYASYDTDGDGYVTGKELQVVIFVAGYEYSYGDRLFPATWAHQYYLDDHPLKLDGKWVAQNARDGDYGGYVLTGERHGDHMATIGTVSHEIGHLLSWPDLYDTDDYPTSSEGVGFWSLMGSGSWNGVNLPGDSPALPDAWLKWYQGWSVPVRATTGARVALQEGSAGGPAMILGSNQGGVNWDFGRTSGTGEFWLVENRQKTGYDAGLPGCGLLVWHVDETVSFYNDANADERRPLLELEQADGRFDLRTSRYPPNRGDAGDPYPGLNNKLAFNNSSIPNSRYYNTNASNFALQFEPGACASTMYVTVQQGVAAANYHYYLPLQVNGALTVSGTLVENGKPIANETVMMMYSTQRGSNATAFSTAVTDSAGRWTLPVPPMNTAIAVAYAYWTNTPGGSNTRAAEFACNPITLETPLLDAKPCVMEVRDIPLVSPGAGARINFPVTFQWQRRSLTTDSYAIEMWNSAEVLIAVTNFVGYSDRATVATAPPGTTINTQYLWSVRAKTPAGIASARYARPIYFRDLSGPMLEAPDYGDWYQPDALAPPRLTPPIVE